MDLDQAPHLDRMVEKRTENPVLVERLDVDEIRQLLPPDFSVMTDSTVISRDSDDFDPTNAQRVAYTTAQDPHILYEKGASSCTLVIAADEFGTAGLIHQPVAFVGDLLPGTHDDFQRVWFDTLVDEAIQGTDDNSRTLFVGGRSPLAPEVVEEIDVILENKGSRVVPLEPDNGGSVTGMIFLPCYLAKDGNNHLFYIDTRHSAEDKLELESALRLRTQEVF